MNKEKYIFIKELFDVRKHLYTVIKRKLTIGIIFIVVMGFILIKTFSETPVYRASAMLFIDSSKVGMTSVFIKSLSNNTTITGSLKKDLNLPFAEKDIPKMVKVDNIGDARLINLTVDCKNASLAASMANKLADLYVKQSTEIAILSLNKMIDFLSAEIGPDSRLRKDPKSFIGPSGAMNNLIAQKSTLEAERQRLGYRYLKKHPKMVDLNDKIAVIEDKMVAEQDVQMGQIIAQKQADIQKAKSEIQGISQYSKIISYATKPDKPVRPDRPKDITFGLMLSFLASLLIVIITEATNDSIRNQADIEKKLNFPYLGEFPKLKRKPLSNTGNVFDEIDKSMEAAEAIRKIRTNLILPDVKVELRTILLTSTIPQEGKSFVSSYLAFSFAKNGTKTLLIDGDTRKPSVNKLFRVDRSPGLTDILAQKIGFDQAVIKTGYENLYLLPCGSAVPSPLELLGTGRMEELIKHALQNYEKIIIDMPPSLALSDAVVLSRIADGIILVARSGMISKDVLIKVRDRFKISNCRLLGVIVNFFKIDEHAHYKDRYYNRYYKNYYLTK